jgi:hypothetical protein
MKLSDINFVRELRSELQHINAMIDLTTGYPRMDGHLVVNGKSLLLEYATVDRLLSEAKAVVVEKIQRYGVEVDE